MNDEEKEPEEQEKKRIEQEQKKQQEINEANKTAHTVGRTAALYYGGQKGAKIYDAVSKTKTGQAVERQLGKKIRRNPISNTISKGLNRSGAIDKVNKAMGAASAGGSAASAADTSYEPSDKADVTLKMPSISLPIVVILIVVLIFIFLFLFISVLLPGIDFFDDDSTSKSKHLAYLSTINSDCKSITVDDTSIPLEDYVANAVTSAIGNDAPYEAKKALSIVTRTHVIKNTNSCKQAISTSDDIFEQYNKNATPNQDTINAVQETKSQIMFEDNVLLNPVYENFCTIEETRSDGTGGFTCDSTMCHVVYSKIGKENSRPNWEKHTVEVPSSYRNNFGGSNCYGMSTVAAIYMANNGNNYETILKKFYSSDTVIEAFTQTDGLELTEIPNYLARTSRATRDNSYYYNQSSGLSANGLEGECAWYGLCRAQEILATSGSSKKFSRGGNGGEFCEVAQNLSDNFPIVTDYSKPKAGSLVVWKGGSSGYGHVAVIEKIIDENTVLISEAGIGIGQFGRTATDLLWTSGSGYNATNAKYGSNALARKANCEGNDSGCQSFKKVSISAIANYGSMNFACYVYLLDN